MTYARAERAELSDLFARVGPDAPTLCEGWTTFDLAAHLVLRERRPDAAGGIALAPLAGYTARVQESLKAKHGFDGLVELVRSGPGGVYGLVPGLDAAVNTMEFFIHHEDVRRAQRVWEPRELPADLEDTFWKRLRMGRGLFLRRSPVGVVLHRIGGGVAVGGAENAPRVEVTGPAGELLLFCFGRQAQARVDLSGDDAAVARLMDAPLGV
ncbi:TIGR03085 family protein [Planobispora rosea]|uniref:TIGR03085 family protein n=1 Tax=Planobispora rosea TaxID=35762 RepID=A0A8J3WBA8_PLARO|nr:TIGR03085 family metal-binding protein [Planobispora rosea]GGS53597.1 TIGR03085 family protein [Planobispora rosea]GIH82637.1 TIGR03085 family protein [Planobispora rosea]